MAVNLSGLNERQNEWERNYEVYGGCTVLGITVTHHDRMSVCMQDTQLTGSDDFSRVFLFYST